MSEIDILIKKNSKVYNLLLAEKSEDVTEKLFFEKFKKSIFDEQIIKYYNNVFDSADNELYKFNCKLNFYMKLDIELDMVIKNTIIDYLYKCILVTNTDAYHEIEDRHKLVLMILIDKDIFKYIFPTFEYDNINKYKHIFSVSMKIYNYAVEYDINNKFNNCKDAIMSLECLEYAHKNGCFFDSSTCHNAAREGKLECLKYAHENNCRWDENTCEWASCNGHLECLKYAHENGCSWDKYTCEFSVRNGHLECLKYAHENGCPWDKFTCECAASNGHLGCLMYAHENGCPWDNFTCYYAARGGHFECLKYAHENGCPFDTNILHYAKMGGNFECLKYAHENVCLCDTDILHHAKIGGNFYIHNTHEKL